MCFLFNDFSIPSVSFPIYLFHVKYIINLTNHLTAGGYISSRN